MIAPRSTWAHPSSCRTCGPSRKRPTAPSSLVWRPKTCIGAHGLAGNASLPRPARRKPGRGPGAATDRCQRPSLRVAILRSAQEATASAGGSRSGARRCQTPTPPALPRTRCLDPAGTRGRLSPSACSDGASTASGTSTPRARRAATAASLSMSGSIRATISRRSRADRPAALRTSAISGPLSSSRNGTSGSCPSTGRRCRGRVGASARYGGSRARPRISTRLELKPRLALHEGRHRGAGDDDLGAGLDGRDGGQQQEDPDHGVGTKPMDSPPHAPSARSPGASPAPPPRPARLSPGRRRTAR